MENICRSITFYSNFVPAADKAVEWKYISLGTVDGIDVSENLFDKNDSQMSVTKAIWNGQTDFLQKLDGSCSAKQMYIVKYGDGEQEKNFWKFEDKYPFYLFCHVQVRMQDRVEMREYSQLEKYLNTLEGIRGITYRSFDNTDILVVLKTASYHVGASTINRLHTENKYVNLKNSYTIFALDRTWLNRLGQNEIDKWNNQRAAKVLFHVMENPQHNADAVRKQIEKCLGEEAEICSPVLGESDAIFLFEDIGWGKLLSLYKQDTGIFYGSTVGCKSNAASISTVIISDSSTVNGTEGRRYSEEEWYRKRYMDKVTGLLNKLKEDSYQMKREVCPELRIVLNALPKFTGEVFNDFVFFFLIKPIEAMIMSLKENDNEQRPDHAGCLTKSSNKEYYYDFINDLYKYVQMSDMSDKYATQGLGMNSKMYNIPVKVNAFYNAFLYNMTEALNVRSEDEQKEVCEYTYMLVPGMQFNVNVNEAYFNGSRKKRLITMRIPEEGVYDIKGMMQILGHETAHYVGHELRMRRERLFCVVKSYVGIFMSYFFSQINDYSSNIEIKQADQEEMKGRIFELLFYELERKRQIIKEKEKEDITYFSVLNIRLPEALRNVLIKNRKSILAMIDGEGKDKQRIDENMDIIMDNFFWEQKDQNKDVESRTILERLSSYYEECFADVMSVLILGISVWDYVEAYISEAGTQGLKREDLQESDLMFRIGTVVLCLYNRQDVYSQWKQEVDRSKNVGDERAQFLEKAIKAACGDNKMNAFDIYGSMGNIDTFKMLKKYLDLCIDKFKLIGLESKQCEELKQLYKEMTLYGMQNGEKQIELMEKEIEIYRQKGF